MGGSVAPCTPEKGAGGVLVVSESTQQQQEALHMLRLNGASAQVQWWVKMQFSNNEDTTFLSDYLWSGRALLFWAADREYLILPVALAPPRNSMRCDGLFVCASLPS